MHCVSNPAMIKVNEVVVGVTSTDVLMQVRLQHNTTHHTTPHHTTPHHTTPHPPPVQLGKAEIAQRPMSSNRLGRLAEHLLKQQSFHPLFPANGGVSGEPVPVDMSMSDKVKLYCCQRNPKSSFIGYTDATGALALDSVSTKELQKSQSDLVDSVK